MPLKYVFSERVSHSVLSNSLVFFLCAVCVSLMSATAWQMYVSSVERWATAKTAVSNIVLAADQQAQDTVHQADNALRDLSERIMYEGMDADQQSRLITLMADQVIHIDGVQGVFIFDAKGNWIANSFSQTSAQKNNSDRDYFIYHRDHDDQSIHIGPIVKSRTTGDMIIPITRRLVSKQGQFQGVALATIPVAYFQSFFQRMDVDDKGVIFMALDNGDLLARRPTLSALMTTNVSKGEIFSRYLPYNDNGTAVITSVVDNVERIYAYRRVSQLPLVVAAGLSYDYVFAPWWAYVYHASIIISIILLMLISCGIVLYTQIQKLIIAENELNTARNDLEVLSQTDSLTGLANRRCFDMSFSKEWARANRNKEEISILLIDIDWFKRFNDHYGHLGGDECLQKVSSIIKSNVKRPTDLAARYGGEEFVILLPNTDISGAMSVAEKIRISIDNALIDHFLSDFGHVTVSCGVSTALPDTQEAKENIFAEADRFLYSAKSGGRNQVQGFSLL